MVIAFGIFRRSWVMSLDAKRDEENGTRGLVIPEAPEAEPPWI